MEFQQHLFMKKVFLKRPFRGDGNGENILENLKTISQYQEN